jgi:RNA polymerase sigma-70 factor (ECF subfamily)
MNERVERLVVSVDDDLERDFEARVSECLPLVFRVAYGVVRHREDAEDVAQEAFAKAYRHFGGLRERTRFRAWLVRITWRLALNRQRNNRRRIARDLVADGTAERTAAETVEQRERAAQLWAAIDALPPKLRLVTVLAGIEGHDVREVALLLGLPDGTVKSRLFLAWQRFMDLLQWTRTELTTR